MGETRSHLKRHEERERKYEIGSTPKRVVTVNKIDSKNVELKLTSS